MDPVRDQPTSEKVVPAAINTITEHPSSICHWCGEMLSSHLSIIIISRLWVALGRPPWKARTSRVSVWALYAGNFRGFLFHDLLQCHVILDPFLHS